MNRYIYKGIGVICGMRKEKIIHKGPRDKIGVCINKDTIEIFTEYKRNDIWFTDQSMILTYEQIDKITELIKR